MNLIGVEAYDSNALDQHMRSQGRELISMDRNRPGGSVTLPSPGANGRAVLAALGYDKARIELLLDSGAVSAS